MERYPPAIGLGGTHSSYQNEFLLPEFKILSQEQLNDFLKYPHKIQSYLRDSLCKIEEQLIWINSDFMKKQQMDQFTILMSEIVFGTKNFTPVVAELKMKSSSKGVCAKAVYQSDVIWECYDCQLQPLCIQCSDCFDKSDHTGHRVKMHRDLNGSCDCGDVNNWKKEGNCRDHQGNNDSIEKSIVNITPQMKERSLQVLQFVIYSLKKQCLIIESYDNIQIKSIAIIELICLTEFISQLVETCPAFIQFFWECLNEDKAITLSRGDGNNGWHECQNTKISKEKKRGIHANSNIQQNRMCECTIFDYFARTNHLINQQIQQHVYALILKLIQSQPIKNMVAESILNNLEIVQKNRDDISSYGNLMIQIYCSDQTKLYILQQEHLRENFIQTINRHLELFLMDVKSESLKKQLTYSYADFTKLGGKMTTQYVINETDLIFQLIDHMKLYYFSDLTIYLNEHTTYEEEYNRKHLYVIEGNVCLALFTFLDQVDPIDLQMNRLILQKFINCFQEIYDKLDTIQRIDEDKGMNKYRQGFFIIPLHHAFARYFNRLIMQNYLLECGNVSNTAQQQFGETLKGGGETINFDQYTDMMQDILAGQSSNGMNEQENNSQYSNDRKLILQIAQRFLNCNGNYTTEEQQQNLVKCILTPQIYSWKFCDEVMSGKWVMCGTKMQLVPKYQYFYNSTIYYSLSLFQLCLAISPKPHETIKLMLKIQSEDLWLENFTKQLMDPGLEKFDAEKISLSQANYDDRKLQSMIMYQIRLYILLACNEIPIYMSLIDKEESLCPLIEEKVFQLFQQDTKREIIHQLVYCGTRADLQQIKQTGLLIYLTRPYYDKLLLEMTDQTKDQQKGKVIFKLKQEYLNQYDPYHFIMPPDQQKANEVVNSLTVEKQQMNLIVGDTFENYQYGCPINYLVASSYSSPDFLNYLAKLMQVCWLGKIDKQSGMNIVNDQIAHMILKLMIIALKGAQYDQTSTQQQKYENVGNILLQNNFLQQLFDLVTIQNPKDDQLKKTVVLFNKAVIEAKLNDYSEQAKFLSEKLIGNISAGNQSQMSLLSQESNKQGLQQNNQPKKEDSKEAAKRKQQEIMNKFKNKRSNFVQQNQQYEEEEKKSSSTQIQNNQNTDLKVIDSSDSQQQSEHEEIECAFCREKLTPQNYEQNAFGRFAYLSRTKLLLQSHSQTFLDIMINQLGDTKSKFLEQMAYNMLLDDQRNTQVITRCSHFAHDSCLLYYLESNQREPRHQQTRAHISLKEMEILCPFCKTISNCLIPQRNFRVQDEITSYFDNYEKKITQYAQKKKSSGEDFNLKILLQLSKDKQGEVIDGKVIKKIEPTDLIQHSIKLMMVKQNQINNETQIAYLMRFLDLNKELQLQVLSICSTKQANDIQNVKFKDLMANVADLASLYQTNQTLLEDLLIQSCIDIEIINCEEGGQQSFEDKIEQQYSNLLKKFRVSVESLSLSNDLFDNAMMSLHTLASLYQTKLVRNRIKYMHNLTQIRSFHENFIKQMRVLVMMYLNKIVQIAKFQATFKTIIMRQKQEATIDLGILTYEKISKEQVKIENMQSIYDPSIYYDTLLFFLQQLFTFLRIITYFCGPKNSGIIDNKIVNQGLIAILQGQMILQQAEEKGDNYVHLGKIVNQIHQTLSNVCYDEKAYDLSNLNNELDDLISSLMSNSDNEITQIIIILTDLADQSFFNNFLSPYIKTQYDPDGQLKHELSIPISLLMLTNNLKFQLIDLPEDYQQFIVKYYKSKCETCNTQISNKDCLCLLCGKVFCMMEACCKLDGKGELSYHSERHEGGVGIFMRIQSGEMILIHEGRSRIKPSLYTNQYGEHFFRESKEWGTFKIGDYKNEVNNAYAQLRNSYMDMTIQNEIISARSISEANYRPNYL
eukprot:403349733